MIKIPQSKKFLLCEMYLCRYSLLVALHHRELIVSSVDSFSDWGRIKLAQFQSRGIIQYYSSTFAKKNCFEMGEGGVSRSRKWGHTIELHPNPLVGQVRNKLNFFATRAKLLRCIILLKVTERVFKVCPSTILIPVYTRYR